MSVSIKKASSDYVAFYEALSSQNLDQLYALCTPDVRFCDPFNDTTGVEAYRTILARMLDDVDAPSFQVTDRALSNKTAYLKWRFTFMTRRGQWLIEGVSAVHFDDHGRITAHIDYWDSGTQFYGRLPVLRHIIGRIRRRLSLAG